MGDNTFHYIRNVIGGKTFHFICNVIGGGDMSAGQQNCQGNKRGTVSQVHFTPYKFHYIITLHFRSMNCLVMTRCRGQGDGEIVLETNELHFHTSTLLHNSKLPASPLHNSLSFLASETQAATFFLLLLLPSAILIHFHMFWSLW